MKAHAALSTLALALPALLTLTGCLSFHKGAMPGEPKDATFEEIAGARVRYRDVGKGPPVVMIHGFASSLETWETVIPEVSKRHRVIALDLKGFGWTDRPEGDYSPTEQAKIVVGLMERRGVEKAAIVAHSWGSSVALALALHAPERVKRITLYDAWVYEDQLPSTFVMARASGIGELLFGAFYPERPDEKLSLAFYNKGIVTEALAEDVERAMDRPGTVAAAIAAVRGQRYADVEQKYRTIDKPVLLLWGREDAVTALKYGERLSRELPRARLVVYPRCGHFPMLEAKEASTTELSKFLAEDLSDAEKDAKDSKEAKDSKDVKDTKDSKDTKEKRP